jgi:hypothetical protein
VFADERRPFVSNVTLKIEFSDGRIEQRSLTPGLYQVGRDVGHIVLGDPNTSARHAELLVEPGRVTITDQGSTNGTCDAAGNRLAGPFVMPQNAPLRLGNSKLTLLPDGPAPGGTRVMSASELPSGAAPGPAAPRTPVAPAPAAPLPAAQMPAPAAAAPARPAEMPAPVPYAPVMPPAPSAGAPSPGAGASSAGEDRTVAIVSYLSLVGFVVALVIHGNKKTSLGAFHLRQTLGYLLTAVAGGIGVSVTIALVAMVGGMLFPFLMLVPLVYTLIWLVYGGAMLALWIMGLLAAINGQMKPMPIVGPLYQKWFSDAF